MGRTLGSVLGLGELCPAEWSWCQTTEKVKEGNNPHPSNITFVLVKMFEIVFWEPETIVT